MTTPVLVSRFKIVKGKMVRAIVHIDDLSYWQTMGFAETPAIAFDEADSAKMAPVAKPSVPSQVKKPVAK